MIKYDRHKALIQLGLDFVWFQKQWEYNNTLYNIEKERGNIRGAEDIRNIICGLESKLDDLWDLQIVKIEDKYKQTFDDYVSDLRVFFNERQRLANMYLDKFCAIDKKEEK